MVTARLGEYLKHKRIRIHHLEDQIGASRSTLSRPIKLGRNIGSHFLEKILNKYDDLNAKWLLTGKGDMLNDLDTINIAADPEGSYTKGASHLLKNVDHIIKNKDAYLELPQFQTLLDSLFLQERYTKGGSGKEK